MDEKPKPYRPLWFNYLRTRRLYAGLSAKDLAALVGAHPSTISRLEYRRQLPSVEVLLGYEALFGKSGRELFPNLYASVHEQAQLAAATMLAELRGKTSPLANHKREFLQCVLEREP